MSTTDSGDTDPPPTEAGPHCTGIVWHRGHPHLSTTGNHEFEPLTLGSALGLQVSAQRSCVGAWQRRGRRPCPFRDPIGADATDAQCRACAAADLGRAFARDAVLDSRRFHLYLAWFGPGMVKVGICATDRGLNRLHEQGALASAWLASGNHAPIRQMEIAIAAAGIAVERFRHLTKTRAWWNRSTAQQRRDELLEAHVRAQAHGNWPDVLRREPAVVVDHVATYGLTELPGSRRPSCVFAGQSSGQRAPPGRRRRQRRTRQRHGPRSSSTPGCWPAGPSSPPPPRQRPESTARACMQGPTCRTRCFDPTSTHPFEIGAHMVTTERRRRPALRCVATTVRPHPMASGW
jgi:hypothetical protein